MPTLSADSILDALGLASKQEEQSAGDIEALLGAQGQLFTKAMQSAQGAADAVDRTTKSAGVAELASQKDTALTKELIGFSRKPGDNFKDSLIGTFREQYGVADGLLQDIQAAKNTSFLSDPLGYIQSQYTLPTMTDQYNIAATRANMALRTINEVDSTLTNEAAANRATKVTLTEGDIKDNATIAANAYKIQANELGYKAIGTDVEKIKVLLGAEKEKIALLHQSYSILNTEEGRRIQRDAAARDTARFEEFTKDKANKEQAEKLLESQIIAGSAVLGLPTPSTTKLAQLKVQYQTPEGKQQLAAILERGADKIANDRTAFGNSPAETYMNVMATQGNFKGTEIEAPLNYLTGQVNDIVRSLKQTGAAKSKADFTEAINNKLLSTDPKSPGLVVGWLRNPENSNPIYHAPPLATVASSEVVQDTAFYKAVLASSVEAANATKSQPTNLPPDSLYSLGKQAVVAGKITQEEMAQGIATYYKVATAINSRTANRLGLPAQNSYPVHISGIGIVTSPVFDFTKPEQVTRAMATDQIISDIKMTPLAF